VRAALGEEGASDDGSPDGLGLREALDNFDEPAAQQALDRLFAKFTVEFVFRDVVLPYLHERGERWQRGNVDVAGEQFASNVLRTRLAGLARGWGQGGGPRAVLACPPGEEHDIPLLAFGLVLNRRGWRGCAVLGRRLMVIAEPSGGPTYTGSDRRRRLHDGHRSKVPLGASVRKTCGSSVPSRAETIGQTAT
jgi:hypothetical protein